MFDKLSRIFLGLVCAIALGMSIWMSRIAYKGWIIDHDSIWMFFGVFALGFLALGGFAFLFATGLWPMTNKSNVHPESDLPKKVSEDNS